ncbi:MAG: C-terminal helicase domain-containing RING finger protein, partial [archaeon]|nr:C-terminal helicase domain-containing RING finger protein [archaeon]
PDWEPTNDLEVRIVYLAALLQLRRHFISREHAILDQTSALSAEDIFDAGDMSGVDSTLLNRLAELTTQRTNLEKTLNFLQNVEDTLRNPETECAICYEPLQGSETSLFKCLHAFCSPCVVGTFRQATEATCPMCRVKSLKRDVCTFKCVIGSPEEPSSSEPGPAAEPTPPVKFYGSKIDVLIASIQKIIATSDDKIVVFGQWAALIISVHEALTVRGLDNQALSDLMETRCNQLDRFRHDPNARVLLLSSENQSSGINLDCANHVFILHPRVVPGTIMPLLESQAFEKQAVGRVHRYPQSKPVFVYRLYARGSVEEELYALCGYFN